MRILLLSFVIGLLSLTCANIQETIESGKNLKDQAEKMQMEQKKGNCSLKPDPGMCKGAIPKFFFDGKECKSFNWGGCQGVFHLKSQKIVQKPVSLLNLN